MYTPSTFYMKAGVVYYKNPSHNMGIPFFFNCSDVFTSFKNPFFQFTETYGKQKKIFIVLFCANAEKRKVVK